MIEEKRKFLSSKSPNERQTPFELRMQTIKLICFLTRNKQEEIFFLNGKREIFECEFRQNEMSKTKNEVLI